MAEKIKEKFDYINFLRWLSIGFTLAGMGIAIAIGLLILTGKSLNY